MKLGSFFSLDGFDNGRRTGAIGLVTYTAPGLLAVLLGAGHWLWIPSLALAVIFGLSLKRRCRDAARPRGYLVAALAPLPLWLLCLVFGWNLAFALVCFAMGLAVTLLMAVLPSRPVKEYDEGFWHPNMPSKEPVLPRREPVLGEAGTDAEQFNSEPDDDDDWDEFNDDAESDASFRRPAEEDENDEYDENDHSARPQASQVGRAYLDATSVRPQSELSNAHHAARDLWRAEPRDADDLDQDDELDYVRGDERKHQGTYRTDTFDDTRDRRRLDKSLLTEADEDEFGLVAEPRAHVNRKTERQSQRDIARGVMGKLKGLWPFGKKSDDYDDFRRDALRRGDLYQDDFRSEEFDSQVNTPPSAIWQQAAGAGESQLNVNAAPQKERTWSDAFNGEGSLEVLMEAIYFHLKRWWRFYLSGAAAVLVIAGGSWLMLRLSQAPNEVAPIENASPPTEQISSVTLESGVTLELEGEALILGWSGQITDAATLWSLATGEGDRHCATALFNNGNRYRPITVVSAGGMREARFSPLDTQAIVKDLALRGNVQLCGQAFGLKGSKTVIESNARFAVLLTP